MKKIPHVRLSPFVKGLLRGLASPASVVLDIRPDYPVELPIVTVGVKSIEGDAVSRYSPLKTVRLVKLKGGRQLTIKSLKSPDPKEGRKAKSVRVTMRDDLYTDWERIGNDFRTAVQQLDANRAAKR